MANWYPPYNGFSRLLAERDWGGGEGEVSLDFGYRLSLSISTGFIGTQYKSLENVIFMFYELLGPK